MKKSYKGDLIRKIVLFVHWRRVLKLAVFFVWWWSSVGVLCGLNRAVLVASRLMTHFTASGGYRIKLQINYRSSVGQGSCVFVGGGGRVLQVLPVIPVRESHRASVSSFTEQAAAIVIM